MKALIDGDVLVYSVGFSVEKVIRDVVYNGEVVYSFPSSKIFWEWVPWSEFKEEEIEVVKRKEVQPLSHALHSMKQTILSILKETGSEEYQIFLTGKGNFREQIAKTLPYKGNRDKSHKPEYYHELKDYLIRKWGTREVDGMEADDALGINQTEDTVICSIDKDLLMIPGNHYNFKLKEKKYINEFEGIRNFYLQLLTGDPTDNIPGLPGIGPKRASKILDGAETEEELYERCRESYKGKEELMEEVANLLWIRRKDRIYWNEGKFEKK